MDSALVSPSNMFLILEVEEWLVHIFKNGTPISTGVVYIIRGVSVTWSFLTLELSIIDTKSARVSCSSRGSDQLGWT